MKKIIIILLFLLSSLVYAENELILKQEKLEQEISKDLSVNKYSIEEPFILINPYEISPLTALIAFDTEIEVKIIIELKDVDDKNKKEILYKTDVYKKKHKIELYKLFSGKNDLEIIVIDKQGKEYKKELTIRTEKITGILKLNPQIVKENVDEDLIIMIPASVSQATKIAGYDTKGRVRWYINKKIIGSVGPFLQLKNGHFMIFSEKNIKPIYYISSAYEMDYMGKIYRELDFKGRGHHEMIELPNSNILVAANLLDDKYDEDCLIEYDINGNIVNIFNFREILNLKEQTAEKLYEEIFFKGSKEKAQHDWMHINSFDYNPKTNEIIVSSRHLNALINIDYKTKKINWILADPINSWLTSELKEKLLKPENVNFKYTYGQHNVQFLENNNILVFDNGNFSSQYRRGKNELAEKYDINKNETRAVEYEIKNGVVKEIWEHTEKDIYTPYIGSVQKLGKNHYFINYGGISLYDGKRCEDILKILFQDEENKGEVYARVIEIKDGKIIYKAETSGDKESAIYRAKKINILK